MDIPVCASHELEATGDLPVIKRSTIVNLVACLALVVVGVGLLRAQDHLAPIGAFVTIVGASGLMMQNLAILNALVKPKAAVVISAV